jgi:dTDP-glucose 4,6-dehydratase
LILVTGGAGFIGSNFVRTYPGECVVVDSLTYAGDQENLRGVDHVFLTADIRDRVKIKHILHRYRPEAIVHFAAESHVTASIYSPEHFLGTNVLGTLTLLEEALQWETKFLHVSTDEVYGSLEPGDAPFTEEHPYRPNNPYAASKAAADIWVRCYFHTYGLPAIITNCGNNYGPFQHPEKLIPKLVGQAMRGEALTVHGDGEDVRDWIHVSDHCAALRLLLDKGEIGQTYNIGASNELTNMQVAQMISWSMPGATPIKLVPNRVAQDRRYALDASKLRALGWAPQIPFERGIKETVDWYADRG